MNIGQRIKQRRKELGLTADQLGEMLGKNRATIYRYENGEIESLPIEIIKSIADFLQTTPADVMGWEAEQKEKSANNDGLSDNKRKLIEFAKSVPEDKADLILRVMRSIVEDEQ